jgi:hypothetical protein
VDRKERTERVGREIEELLGQGKVQGAWHTLKAWYRHASGRATHPSRQDLHQLKTEYGDLLANKQTQGDLIPVLVAPFRVDDNMPTEKEINREVGQINNGRSPGPTGMRPNDLKEWCEEARRDENPDTTKWDKVVALVQYIFETGRLPTQLTWCVLVAIPKPSGGFCGIGLLELMWKLIYSTIYSRMKENIQLQSALYGFRPGRGTGTASIEVKLIMQLATIHQRPV